MGQSEKMYDFAKAKKYIEDRIESISEAALGMHEDWFWTAEAIFENGEFVKDLTSQDLNIAGIDGSFWATPTLNIIYKDGTSEMIECFIGEQDIPLGEKIAQQISCTSGCLSSVVQENIQPLKT